MRKLWKDLSDEEKIRIGKVWKSQAKRIKKEKRCYLVGEGGVPLRDVNERLNEIARSLHPYKIYGDGPFAIIETKPKEV